MAKSPSPAPRKEAPSEFDFSKHSLEELAEIRRSVEAEIQSRQAQEVEALRAKVAEAAQTLGMSVEEMLGLGGTRQRRYAKGSQPPKYRGPNGEEWSGRGPAPRWMKPFLAQGKTKADFLINKER